MCKSININQFFINFFFYVYFLTSSMKTAAGYYYTLMKQLIPLYACMVVGAGGAVYYLLRLATRNPDISWNRKKNPEPWEEYRTKQYKVSKILSVFHILY